MSLARAVVPVRDAVAPLFTVKVLLPVIVKEPALVNVPPTTTLLANVIEPPAMLLKLVPPLKFNDVIFVNVP
jgi:hypothetical protein